MTDDDQDVDLNEILESRTVERTIINDHGESVTVYISPIEDAALNGILEAHREWAYEGQIQEFIDEEERELAEERKRVAEREAKNAAS